MLAAASSALREFLRQESAGGIILIGAALLALAVANSAASAAYFGALDVPLSISAGPLSIAKPMILWINDGLMAVFFFLVGLEVKREIVEGQLSSWDKASLPLIAALGGMVMPALIFLAINADAPANLAGWAVPAATDIAFALGILSLLGPRVPVSLKALLLAIAVIDDIGAIVIIALFYSGKIDLAMLGGGALTLMTMVALNRLRVGSSIPYLLLALVLWVFVLKSGVHGTLAGVAAAATIPMTTRHGKPLLAKMEHALHPWVAFLVIPVFGFANAGVSFSGISLADVLAPLPLGIAAGLLIGKQIGILGFAWAAVRLGLASLPEDVNWRHLHGLSLLAAIGFTMSLFIGSLAFIDPAQVDAVKLGVLSASLLAGICGYGLLRAAFSRNFAR